MVTKTSAEVRRAELAAVLSYLEARPWPDGVDAARAHYDSLGDPIAPDIRVEPLAIEAAGAQRLVPPEHDPDRALLYLHGGGYVFGSLQSHGGMAAEVARAARCAVLQLDYRRAPEHPYPAAVDDAVAAYRWLLAQGLAPGRIAIAGDSAGGGLVLCMLARCKELGVPLAGAAVCLSPWVDMEATGESYRTREAIDPLVQRKVVDEVKTRTGFRKTAFGTGMIWYVWWLAVVSFVGILAVAIGHTFNYKRDFYIPVEDVTRHEDARTTALMGAVA